MKKAKRILVFCIVAALLILLVTGEFAIRRLLLHEKYQNEQIDMLLNKNAENETRIEDLKEEIFRLNKVSASLDDSDGIYEKLQNGCYVNILIVGDSIGEGTGASGREHQWFSY